MKFSKIDETQKVDFEVRDCYGSLHDELKKHVLLSLSTTRTLNPILNVEEHKFYR